MILEHLDQVCQRTTIADPHRQAWNALLAKGLPSRKDEAWKYTNLSGLYQKHAISAVYCACANKAKEYDFTAHVKAEYLNIVLVDGICVLDQTQQLEAIDIVQLDHNNPMASMAQAMSAEPKRLSLKRSLEKPIFIHVFQNQGVTGNIVNYSLEVVVAANVAATIRYDYHGINGKVSSANMLMKLTLGDNAQLTLDHVQACSDMDAVIATQNIYAQLGRNAKLGGFYLSTQAKLDRVLFHTELNGEGAELDLQGLYLLNHKDHGDYHIVANHHASHTRSNVAFRAIVNGQAKATFNAKAMIQQGIKAIQAFQNNRNIQLSLGAEINTKPELEIYADDVACSHGATIGRLDDNALFYLRSRGIPLDQARQLLIESFVKSLLNNIQRSDEVISEYSQAIDRAIVHTL